MLRAKCNKPSLPNKERIYAMKVLTNYFQTQTQTQVRVVIRVMVVRQPFSLHCTLCLLLCVVIAFTLMLHTQVRQEFQNEYSILCQLPPHENIIHMWAFFYDRASPDNSPLFKRAGRNARTMSLFLLMDELPTNMKDHVDTLVDNQGPKVNQNFDTSLDTYRYFSF